MHPGTNDFWYPQWIPGQELPGGPIDSLTGIFFRAGGEDGVIVPWRRDLTNPYEFHVQVPGGVSLLNVRFDVLEVPSRFNKTSPDTIGSHVALLETSDVVLYRSRTPVNAIPVTVTVHVTDAWKAATALRVDEAAVPTLNGPETTFHTVSVEQFVDSPILAGQHCRQYPLAPEVHPVHTLDLCADNDGGLEIKPEFLAHMSELVRQTTKLFQGHHYDHFDFLVALSPHLTGGGLEHTQSTHYVVKASSLGDPAIEDFAAYLMAHEYTHAWCGKYRRPAGDATPDYNTPMQNDLLWVYEGLAEYYGGVLAARSGFRTADQA